MYCGQTAGWIKMKLGTQVDLGPGHIVLDGDPAPLPKGAEPPIFGPYLFWQYGWMDQDASWYGDRPHPGDFVLDGDPARLLPPQKGGGAPNFRPVFIVAKPYGSLSMLTTLQPAHSLARSYVLLHYNCMCGRVYFSTVVCCIV